MKAEIPWMQHKEVRSSYLLVTLKTADEQYRKMLYRLPLSFAAIMNICRNACCCSHEFNA